MAPAEVAGLILAGGAARRMQGVDKGALVWHGQPLIAWVYKRLAPQVAEVIISANRSWELYRSWSQKVVSDPAELQGMGPAAGMIAGCAASAQPWLAVVPVDGPCLPRDLVQRLLAARAQAVAKPDGIDPVVVASDGIRYHPTYLLLHRSHALALRAFLATGRRSLAAWLAEVPHCVADFSDQPRAFLNLNTREALKATAPCDDS